MVKLSTYTTGDYNPGPLLKRVFWYLASLWFFENGWPWPMSFKRSVLRSFGAKVGVGVVIKPSVKIKYPWFFEVGDHSWIGEGVWIDNVAQVTLGHDVVLSQDAYLLTGNHDYKAESFDLMLGPIHVADGAWIAARSVVCPGVIMGKNAILTVGSVASGTLTASGIYSGNPAELQRKRSFRSDEVNPGREL